MCINKKLAVLLMGLGFCFTAQAQTPILSQAELAGIFNESHSPEVLVSGVVVVGVLADTSLSGGGLRNIVISPVKISSDSQQVCLIVSSKDGVYRSENTYNVPTNQGKTPVVLPYEQSRYLQELSSYADGDLTALATKGACSEASNEKYIITTNTQQEKQNIRLHINSLMATDVYLSLENDELIHCDSLDGRNTNYDYVCTIPAHYKDASPLKIQVERERFGRPQATVHLELL